MPIKFIPSQERGMTKLDWLQGYHSFSFNRYVNPDRERFGPLIVFNDDYIKAAKGFGAHPHENAEIVTIVLSGSVKHEDSMGNKGIIKAGEIQRMSAGTGVFHSEKNASDTEDLHLLQIWLEPRNIGEEPSYEQGNYLDKLKTNELTPIISGRLTGTYFINRDADFLIGKFETGTNTSFNIEESRGAFIFCISGSCRFAQTILGKGDAIEAIGPESISLTAEEDSEILVIDLALKNE